jgi:AcrR family transcriptional regulator
MTPCACDSMNDMKPQRPDGRAERALKGRRRVSEALVALVVASGRMPSVEEVAARAGVGRRSVFRYFDGVGALEVETARAMRALMTERVPLPAPLGSLDRRLAALVRHRARLYERIGPVRRFLEAARQRGNTAFDGFIDDGRRVLRENLEGVLEPELAGRPGLLPALELLTSWEAWVALREGQRRSPAAAQRVLREAISAVVAAPVRRRVRAAPPAAKATSPGRAAPTH